MAQREKLTITEVKPIEKVGDKQIPKLSFKAGEHWYQTFRRSLFDAIKVGQTIDAEIEISTREYQGNEYTDRKIMQIYADGQPMGGKKEGSYYRGKSPQELKLSAKSYALAYAKDLAVAQVISLKEITKQADVFYKWLRGDGKAPAEDPVSKKAPEIEAPQPEKAESLVDMAWLQETLGILKGYDSKSYSNTNIILYLNKITGANAKTVADAVQALNKEQASEFVEYLQQKLREIEP